MLGGAVTFAHVATSKNVRGTVIFAEVATNKNVRDAVIFADVARCTNVRGRSNICRKSYELKRRLKSS
jgi:hypothetical protein